MTMPKIPVTPRNGMIRVYDNQERTFTDPYSTKTVFFYKEGDEYFTGVRVPISKSRYRTFDRLLDDLNENIHMPFGVRRLTTPMGRTSIHDIAELQHLGKYVATSSKYSRGINLSALERLKKAREQTHNSLRRKNNHGQSFWVPTSPTYKQKLRMGRSLGLDVVPSKQVFFVLNGKGRFYRTLLHPFRLPPMETLLHEVSEGLQVAIFRLYSMNGSRISSVNEILNLSPPKVLACTRIERPHLGTVMLPNIDTHRSDTKAPHKHTSYSLYASSSAKQNGIEKKSHTFTTALKRNIRYTTGVRKKRATKPSPVVPPSEKVVAKTEDTDSGMANSISSRMTETPKIEDDHEFAFNEEIERHLREAEKQLIPEDDESSEEISYSVRRPETNSSSSSIMSPRKHQDIPQKQEERSFEEELPSTAGTSKSDVRSEAERKAELIMEKRIEEIREDEMLSKNGNSDVEEILISDDDVNNETMVALDKTSDCEDASPILRNESDSDKEEILASDDEVDLDSQRRSNLSTSFRNHVDSSSLNDEKKAQTSRSDNNEELNEEINKPSGATRAVDSDREEILPSDDEELNNREKAAITIQAAFRGYQAREKVKMVHITEQNNPSNANVTDIEESRQQEVTEQEETASMTKQNTHRSSISGAERPKKITYTISITTGNRWGAETEANLYIQMFGDEQTSRRFYLKQEVHRKSPLLDDQGKANSLAIRFLPERHRFLALVDWLQSGETRFRQRHMDLFHVETENLGTIHQVIIGHEAEGYGAGIFIDYVLITENLVDGRQFVCYCSKWFDSGQVDGKIERILSVSAFYYLDSAPDKSVISQGRWEVILHNGMEDGTGGTTSNLIIIGYGTKGSSVMHIGNDKTMLAVPDTTLIQMDFGAIGDLLKIRFEIDGAGEQPDYYIEWAELRDLDTDERTTVRVAKWMDITGTRTKRPQAFREISIFRSGEQPLQIQHYDGKVTAGDLRLLNDGSLQARLIGDYSDSGTFPLICNREKKEYSFKVECVHLGRINCIKIIGNFTEKGQAILEGFSVLQELWDKHVGNVQTAGDIVATSAVVRESTHCPYRYVLRESKIRELQHNNHYFKVLTFTDMEGLSTRNKKHTFTSETDDWVLEMSIKGQSKVIPDVSLCSGYQAFPMSYQPEESGEKQYTYEMKGSSIGNLQKLRVGMGELENTENFYIKKMRLENRSTKTMVRFPSVDIEFERNQVYEFSPTYPDVQPTLNILYTISLTTTASSGTFHALMNIIGEEGDSGMRKFHDNVHFTEGSSHTFDVDAINLGPLKELDVLIEGDENSSWSVDIVVGMADNNIQYATGLVTIPTPKQLVRLTLQQR